MSGRSADLLGQHAVAFRALHQRREAAARTSCADWLSATLRTTSRIAAADQHVGDGLADAGAAGDREQMRLALGLGDVDQIGFVEPRRLRQHRTGDRDVVVVGELAHHARPAHCRPAPGDAASSARALASISAIRRHEHVVEQADMIFVEVARRRRGRGGDALSVSARRSAEPCWMTSSSSGISDADADILDPDGVRRGIDGSSARPQIMRGSLKERLANCRTRPLRPCAGRPNRYISAHPLMDIS